MKKKMAVLTIIAAMVMLQLCMVALATSQIIDSTSGLTSGGESGRTPCVLEATREHFSAAQVGTEGTQYAAEGYYGYRAFKADSWRVSGTFYTPYTSTNKTNRATDSNSCQVSSFLSNSSTYEAASFTSTAISSDYGNITLELNVVY